MMVKHAADSVAAEQLVVKHAGAAGQSRFVTRIRRRYEQELGLLPPGAPRREVMLETLAALRVTRQLVLERLAVLDVEEGAAMGDVTRAVTELAEVTLDRAVTAGRADRNQLHLDLDAPAPAQKPTITYLDSDRWNQSRLLKGTNHLAALTFCEVPIQPAR